MRNSASHRATAARIENRGSRIEARGSRSSILHLLSSILDPRSSILSLIALLACTAAVGLAQIPPGVEIKLRAQPEKATVGDPIQIDFEITLPLGYQVRFPALAGELGEFAIIEPFSSPGTPGASPASGPAGASSTPETTHRARIIVGLYKVGKFEFPPIELVVLDPEGKETKVSSPSAKIEIESVLTDKDQNLKELKKQAEIHEPVRWALWSLVGLLVLILAALVRWWWRRRQQRRPAMLLPAQPQPDPFLVAEAELRALLGRRLLERGLVKEFYVVLSDIVKKVLEAGYGIQTVEKTTIEIMDGLRGGSPDGHAEDLERIESFLLGCDLVKFAKYVPAKSESDGAAKEALQILETCKKQKALPATARAVPAGEVP